GADHPGDGGGLRQRRDHAPRPGLKAVRMRWQERFMREGVAGLLRDKTRKPGLPPLPASLVDRVVALTLGEPPGQTTRWTGRAMVAATRFSLRWGRGVWGA